MKIRDAKPKDIVKSLVIAKGLKEWFTEGALEKMKKDFRKNMIVAFEKEVVGFLNYKINKNYTRILWIGVDKKYRREGIGKKLLKKLEEITEENNVKGIVVNTLSHKDDYEPYKSTRNFYLKNGFVYGHILSRKKGEDEQIEMEKGL